MKLFNALVAVAALSANVAMAGEHKAKASKTPNCDVGGKMSHVKDEAACTKKHGKFTPAVAAAPAAEAPAATPAPAAEAPAAAPTK